MLCPTNVTPCYYPYSLKNLNVSPAIYIKFKMHIFASNENSELANKLEFGSLTNSSLLASSAQVFQSGNILLHQIQIIVSASWAETSGAWWIFLFWL